MMSAGRTSHKQTKMKNANNKLGPGRIIRAVLIGVFLYVLITMLPFFILKFHGVQQAANMVNVTNEENSDEPVYHDSSGKRINEADFQILSGYETAKESNIASHAACKSMEKIFHQTGCHKYVTEQKHIPPHIKQKHVDPEKSTAQCRAEVNAYYEALIQDMREQGDNHAADSWSRRNWTPELKECQNNDNVRISSIIYEPAGRLDEMLKKLEQGGVASEQDRAMVLKDLTAASQFPDGPAKLAYIEKSNYFFRLADSKQSKSP
jgi:hypothetical protein